MSNFKFYKIKDKFRWESYFMCLEFSKPAIIPFEEFVPIKNTNRFMHYYYMVNIYNKNPIRYSKEKYKYILVSSRNVGDFPAIFDLRKILKLQLKDDSRIDGAKVEYRSGKTRYTKSMSTGSYCEDFYEIKKDVDDKGIDERYVVYCGNSYDIHNIVDTIGIRTPYVDKIDIQELLKCVNAFISYSIKQHNQIIAKNRCYCEIQSGKLYKYDYKKELISIFNTGDMVKCIILSKDNQSEELVNCQIKSISKNTITFENKSSVLPKQISLIKITNKTIE